MTQLTLEKMCPEVFALDENETRILRYLALYGPMNINKLSKFTSKYVDTLERWGVKKRLYGTERFMGLIPNDYVIEATEGKKRYGREEKVYFLSVKGIIAIIPVVPLQKNKFFIRYVDFQSTFYKTKGIRKFIEAYLMAYIKLLVSWHYLHGIQLTKQKSSSFYYEAFFDNVLKEGIIDINIPNNEIKNEFDTILKNCVKYYTIIDLVTNGQMHRFQKWFSLVNWERTSRIPSAHTDNSFGRLWKWPSEITDLKLHGKKYDEVSPYILKSLIFVQDSYSRGLKKEINEILKTLELNKEWESLRE